MPEEIRASEVPPVPGFWRFLWLFFFQPFTLRKMHLAWGQPLGASFFGWLRKLLAASGPIQKRVRRRYIQAILLPFLGISAALTYIEPKGMEEAFFLGIVAGFYASALGTAVSGEWVSAVALRGFLVLTIALAVVTVSSAPRLKEVAGITLMLASGLVTLTRLPDFLVSTVGFTVLRMVSSSDTRARLSRLLPFRHHELLLFPLPGLGAYLTNLANENPRLALERISEARASVGQEKIARLALAELVADELEGVAREKRFGDLLDNRLTFVPAVASEGIYSRLLTDLTATARDLLAETTAHSFLRRQLLLDSAERTLFSASTALYFDRRPTPEERRLDQTVFFWQVCVTIEKNRLAQDRENKPQIPSPFIAGKVLKPSDEFLFRGRTDFIRMIDEDLSGINKGVLLLYGQRRMGKSSLINLFPSQLGNRTLVVPINFQGLSGEKERGRPHFLVCQKIAKAEALSPPAVSDAWRPALDWLHEVEKDLRGNRRRLLVPIDEIERLEDGRRDGWVGTDFLDFLRAAGDELRVTRFLLASAHRPARLGPVWVDRLISALPRELGPLDEPSARSLLVEPEPNFPDIYPPGGVDHILERTGCHPYLLQLVGDELTRHLNTHQRLKATDDDLDEAFGQALLKAGSILFQNLWNDRNDPERAVLLAAATGATLATPDPATRQDLLRDGFLRPDGQLATPLFAEWIAQRGGAGA